VCVPGDFTVRLGDVMPAYVLEELDEEFAKFGGAAEAASGFLSAVHWVEEEGGAGNAWPPGGAGRVEGRPDGGRGCC